jgi:hypothetical protein
MQFPQSITTPLALIVLDHFAISLPRNSCKYSGDLRSGATKSAPIFFICAWTVGMFIAATVASCSFWTIAVAAPGSENSGRRERPEMLLYDSLVDLIVVGRYPYNSTFD